MQDANRVLERLPREDVGRLEVALDERHDLTPRRLGELVPARVDGRNRRSARSVSPSASVTHAMVDAVPMVMQCPFDRDIEFSISTHSAW